VNHANNLALLTDLYQLTMAQSYFQSRKLEPATFSLFARRLPEAVVHADLIRANLEFIAASREWVPALIAEVERLRVELGSITGPTM